MNRIISKEEEREDPRRELQSSFQLESKSVCSVSTCNPAFLQELQVFPHVLQSSTLILHTELILLQEILQLQGSSHADYYKASSSDCSPYIQAFHMAEQGLRLPYSIPGPHGTSRLPVNSTQQKQHSKWQPASTQPLHSTRRNRIHFKRGQVLYIYAILRSVCSNLLIRIILQE